MIPVFIQITNFIQKKTSVDEKVFSNKQILEKAPVAIEGITGKSFIGEDNETIFIYLNVYGIKPGFYLKVPAHNIYKHPQSETYFIKNNFVLKTDKNKKNYIHNVKNGGNVILFFELWHNEPKHTLVNFDRFVIKNNKLTSLSYTAKNEKYGGGTQFGLLGMAYRDEELKSRKKLFNVFNIFRSTKTIVNA